MVSRRTVASGLTAVLMTTLFVVVTQPFDVGAAAPITPRATPAVPATTGRATFGQPVSTACSRVGNDAATPTVPSAGVNSSCRAPAPVDPPNARGPQKRPPGFGVPAIRPLAAVGSGPQITRADAEQYVASHSLGIGSLRSSGQASVVTFQCGSQAEIEALLPYGAKLVDMPPGLLCVAETQGTFRVLQPGAAPAQSSRLFIVFDAQTGNLVAKVVG